jgi:hypothetical protein
MPKVDQPRLTKDPAPFPQGDAGDETTRHAKKPAEKRDAPVDHHLTNSREIADCKGYHTISRR